MQKKNPHCAPNTEKSSSSSVDPLAKLGVQMDTDLCICAFVHTGTRNVLATADDVVVFIVCSPAVSSDLRNARNSTRRLSNHIGPDIRQCESDWL